LSIRGAEPNKPRLGHSSHAKREGGPANPTSATNNPTQSLQDTSLSLLDMPKLDLVDKMTSLPRSDLRSVLIELFFRHFGSIFPFADRHLVNRECNLPRDMSDPGTVMMINAMCALSAR
jgi:hypothetical protein